VGNISELRRKFLREGIRSSLLLPLLGSGLLRPGRVLASEWKSRAFTARSTAEALQQLAVSKATESRDIVINAPEIAENGAKVDVEITCNLPGARSLLLLADRNPMPLCAEISFSGKALPYAKLQIKLAESTQARALIRTNDGRTHVAIREIKVTLGGCGG
jgi:sulfur-oxidizing protein SoxY